jgi:DNA-binding NarL/FixJ family response regulator
MLGRASRTPSRRRSTVERTPGTPPESRARIVVVDDHSLVRAGLVELVRNQADMEVCGEAADTASALSLIRREKPDLVVVDLMLQDGTGMDLIKQAVAEGLPSKFLVCSMYDETLYAERVLAVGAMGYVSKQEPSRVVLEAMRKVLSGWIYTSEEIADRVLRRSSGKITEPGDSPVDILSDRELEVLGLLGQGLNTREIAGRLELSTKTIDTYREHIKMKLGLKNANELLRFAVAWTLDPSNARGRTDDPSG